MWRSDHENKGFSIVDGEMEIWALNPSGVRRGLCPRDYRAAYSKTPQGIAVGKRSQARADAKAYEVGARISILESEAVQTGAVLI